MTFQCRVKVYDTVASAERLRLALGSKGHDEYHFPSRGFQRPQLEPTNGSVPETHRTVGAAGENPAIGTGAFPRDPASGRQLLKVSVILARVDDPHTARGIAEKELVRKLGIKYGMSCPLHVFITTDFFSRRMFPEPKTEAAPNDDLPIGTQRLSGRWVGV